MTTFPLPQPKKHAPRLLTCPDCGETFEATGPRSLRCKKCAHLALNSGVARYLRKKRKEQREAMQTGAPAGHPRKYRLIFDPSGDYSIGAHFDAAALPGAIYTNYEAWEVGTKWTDGVNIFVYSRKGKAIERVTS